MKHEESAIQAAIVSALSLAGIYCFMVGNDAAGKTTAARASRLKAMGLRAGVADLVIMGPDGRAHFLEIKTATGRLSPAQVAFRDLCVKRNWTYCVARSVAEAMEIVKELGLV